MAERIMEDGIVLLENAGFVLNQELIDFYNSYGSDKPEMLLQKQSWTLPEPPVSLYSAELIGQASYDDNSSEYEDFPAGEHYLQLSRTERDMVEMVCSNFSNVVVVYNGANQFELGFVEEYEQIKAAVWCPGK